ncbi:uncharacterized protein LOC115966478 [Quercus lobata]|uniref:uncharacterized protein LOC115966478 n=1 Tax=Quercus lobata TaxID=97700 RepID=UPI001247802B|nr:uncharacterized protein LOC115966478 [Quercus lobata]
MQGKTRKERKRKWGWAYLEVREKTEEVRSKIRVGEINRTENGEMEKAKRNQSRNSRRHSHSLSPQSSVLTSVPHFSSVRHSLSLSNSLRHSLTPSVTPLSPPHPHSEAHLSRSVELIGLCSQPEAGGRPQKNKVKGWRVLQLYLEIVHFNPFLMMESQMKMMGVVPQLMGVVSQLWKIKHFVLI